MSRYRLTDLEIIREEGSWLCTVRDQHDNKEELLLVPCDSTEHQPVRAWFNECELTPGSSPSFDTELVRAIEPGTPSPRARWKALYQLRKAGVNVFVSFSPTYPGMTDQEIDTLLGHFRALGQIVVFHEPINPRGKNFQLLREAVQKLDRPELEKRFEMLQSEQKWIKYAIEQINRVHRRAKKLYPDLHIHSWPDRELIENTSGHLSDRLAEMRQAVPAEVFNKKKQSQSSVQSTIFESESELADLVL